MTITKAPPTTTATHPLLALEAKRYIRHRSAPGKGKSVVEVCHKRECLLTRYIYAGKGEEEGDIPLFFKQRGGFPYFPERRVGGALVNVWKDVCSLVRGREYGSVCLVFQTEDEARR